MKDEIIEELWQIKDIIAKECNYDLDKLVEKLRIQERSSQSTMDPPSK